MTITHFCLESSICRYRDKINNCNETGESKCSLLQNSAIKVGFIVATFLFGTEGTFAALFSLISIPFIVIEFSARQIIRLFKETSEPPLVAGAPVRWLGRCGSGMVRSARSVFGHIPVVEEAPPKIFTPEMTQLVAKRLRDLGTIATRLGHGDTLMPSQQSPTKVTSFSASSGFKEISFDGYSEGEVKILLEVARKIHRIREDLKQIRSVHNHRFRLDKGEQVKMEGSRAVKYGAPKDDEYNQGNEIANFTGCEFSDYDILVTGERYTHIYTLFQYLRTYPGLEFELGQCEGGVQIHANSNGDSYDMAFGVMMTREARDMIEIAEKRHVQRNRLYAPTTPKEAT